MHLICLCILLQFWSSNTFAFNCDTDDYENEDYCYSTPDDDQPLLQRQRRAVNFYQTGKKVQNDMSRTLDQIFGSNYNKRIRPNYGGKPVLVDLNLSIRSIVSISKLLSKKILLKIQLQGPVSEKKQDYYVDCYFRQSWYDTRLIFNETGGITALPMNWQFLNKIWKPDTFFVNGKKSKMHKITVPNKFLRIAPDGKGT